MIHSNSATEGGMVALLAESSAEKSLAIQSTLERIRLLERLVCVPTGMEVLAYLHGDGEYGDRLNCPLPNLLMLGRNLPVISGIAVLCCLRSESRFEHLPVIMANNSFTRAQIATANWMGAACCRQPDSAEDLMQAIAQGVRLALRPEKENESLSRVVLNPNGPCFPQARRSSDNLITLSLA